MPEEQTDDLGTQVFIFDPDAPLTELTADIGPGFGNQRNKYSWSGTMFDGDNDGVEELYVGTFNVELSPTGTLAGVVRLSTLIQAGGFGDGLLGLLTAEFPRCCNRAAGKSGAMISVPKTGVRWLALIWISSTMAMRVSAR